MANKGYTTESAVAAYLGRSFTTPQTAEATTLIGAVESYIDRETRSAWLIGPITDERYDLVSSTIYLRSRPVTSVTTIKTRTQAIGDTLLTLTAGIDYELLDPSIGQVNLVSGFRGPRAVAYVSYVPNLGVVPGDIALAATLIVAASMMATIFPDRLGIQKAVVDRDVQMTYVDSSSGLQIPQAAYDILCGYKVPIFA